MQAADTNTFAGLTSQGLVLVKYWAEWCHPCHQMSPALAALESEMPSLKVVSVNVDTHRGIATQNQVRAIPALHLYRDGQCVGTKVGLSTVSEIRQHFSL